MNSKNWKSVYAPNITVNTSGVLVNATLAPVFPPVNATVRFPASMGKFGWSDCATDPSKCRLGGTVSVTGPSGQKKVSMSLNKIELARNGRLALRGDVNIRLFEKADPPVVSWDDHGPTSTDLACANNWVVAGTDSNPDFKRPCHQDSITLPNVCKPRGLPSFVISLSCIGRHIHGHGSTQHLLCLSILACRHTRPVGPIPVLGRSSSHCGLRLS